ncbi:MAG: anaerobic ribonucleoside-triphosphate reductase activating protein [Clostridia bacterium]|nr:anaerobic ribonucleoside-triphosphate reductase activating protein [Clostridia bacterium]
MYYGEIKNCDVANGEGVRISLFVSGCTHHCKDCFNPQTWSFTYGQPYTEETEAELLRLLAPDYINGITLLGGEPMEPDNQRALLPLVKKIREQYPDKSVWCFTGYTLDEDLWHVDGSIPDSRAFCEVTETFLSMIDVLIDGEFVAELKNISLRFRGSENQRIIDMKKTREAGEVVLWGSKNDDVNRVMKMKDQPKTEIG